MSRTTVNLPELCPPLPDEEIQRALVEVDARLSAFVSAIGRVREALTGPPGHPDESVGVAEEQGSAPPTVTRPARTAVQATGAAEPEQAPAGTAAEAPPTVAPTTHQAVDEPEPVLPPPTETPPPGLRQSTAEEDEALLASLDPETAKAIRVMRRLSVEKKSVRQLLEEYNPTGLAAGTSEPRKKSWWSRG